MRVIFTRGKLGGLDNVRESAADLRLRKAARVVDFLAGTAAPSVSHPAHRRDDDAQRAELRCGGGEGGAELIPVGAVGSERPVRPECIPDGRTPVCSLCVRVSSCVCKEQEQGAGASFLNYVCGSREQ